MFLARRQQIEQRLGIRLSYVAIADSSGVLSRDRGLTAEQLSGALRAKGEGRSVAAQVGSDPGASSLDRVAAILTEDLSGFDDRILVDATAAERTASLLESALQHGWGVALANKLPMVEPLAHSRTILAAAGRRLRYEATVGAGLPVIATLHSLLGSGDEVQRIDGSFSGTLGLICSRLQQGQRFSAIVHEAKALGYTEPDPREDLGGMDVARKALILDRTLGRELELADVQVEPLFPQEMASLSLAEFMDSLQSLDAPYAERVAAAHGDGCVLRYVAEVREDGRTVGWREVGQEDLMAALRGPDNIIRFFTRRYGENPLVIVGPGAGPEVTAAGVLSDILDLAGQTG
jgi:homoserine dehydrogenase